MLRKRLLEVNQQDEDGEDIALADPSEESGPTCPTFARPDQPDPTLIMALHRSDKGVVTFHRKDEKGEFEDLFSISTTYLEKHFPALRKYLDRDAFFSINSLWEGTPTERSKVVPRYHVAERRDERVQWLNAVYVDMDCHNLGVSEGATIGRLLDLEDLGEIPPASIVVKSGRGVWAFWLLRNSHPRFADTDPVRAVEENKRVHRALEQKLCEVLDPLGADPACIDAPRITRVPGSINSKSGRRVQYLFKTDETGTLFTYTLDQICQALYGQSEAQLKQTLRGTPRVRLLPNRSKDEKKREAQKIMLRRRLGLLEQLRQMRGGFQDGCRNRAVLIIADVMKKLGHTPEQIRAKVEEIGADCVPPLPRYEQEARYREAISGKHTIHRISNERLAHWLLMTPIEIASLGLSLTPPQPKMSMAERKAQVEARRACVRDLVQSGRVQTLEELARALDDQYYMTATPMTLSTDLKAMKLKLKKGRSK